MDREGASIAIALAVLLLVGWLAHAPGPGPSGPAAGEEYVYHAVRQGETLFSIARRYGTTVQALVELNGIQDPHRILAGEVLRVPLPQDPLPAMASAGPAASGSLPSARARPAAPSDGDGRSRERSVGQARDLELLARIIWLEARGEPFEGQVAVGAVVLNRVASRQFPDTVEEVLAQPGQFGFSMAEIWAARPGPTAFEAAARALAGEDPTGGALFFYNPEKTRTPEFWATRPVLRRIGQHVFTL